MRLKPEKVNLPVHKDKIMSTGEQFYGYVKTLLVKLDNDLSSIRHVVNYNERYIQPRAFAQDAQPAIKNGEIALWEDTDAASGDPKCYLVYKNDAGDTFTFGSEETVA